MSKSSRFLLLSLSLGISLLAFNPFVFADETLTIATYYPSPYGSYNQLQSNQLSVGDTNADSQMTSADLPPANGQIYAARGIILKPQSSLPSSNLVAGEVVYNDSDKKLYSYDGSAWAAVGGSAGSSGVTMMSAESASTYSHAGAAQYCYNLSATAAVDMNGDTSTTYTDWRLPSASEAAVFEGTITSTNYIWIGTVCGIYYTYWIQLRLTDGSWGSNTPGAGLNVRCVR